MRWHSRISHGLRLRLLWVLVPVLMGLLVLDSWRDSVSLARELAHAYDQSLLEPAQALSDGLGWDSEGQLSLDGPLHVISMFEAVSSRRKFLRVQLQTPDGAQRRLLLGADQFPEPAQDPADARRPFRAAADGTRVFYAAEVDHQPVRVLAMLRVLHDRAGQEWRVLIQSAQTSAGIERTVRSLMWDSLLRDGRTLLVLVLVVWLGVAWGLRPLKALRRTVQQRRSDDLEPLATTDVPGEVRPLVDAMNLHLAQQRDALAQQRQFLADASHQLRTPLAILTTQAGYALRETDPEAVQATLRSMLQQLQRGRRVSEQLLALAHASQPASPMASEAELCDANAVAREVVLAYLPLALDKQQDLGWTDVRGQDFDEDDAANGDGVPQAMAAAVQAPATAVYELVANLVHNAIVYTPAQGHINVAVLREPGWVEIRVLDNGPGIAAQDRERALARFSRLQANAAQAPGGSGLGLAIARAYVQRFQGELVLARGEGPEGGGRPGLLVRIRLPLAAAIA
jgi:two-component system sensor histidine kinase TctE